MKLLWKKNNLHISSLEECPNEIEVFDGLFWQKGKIVEEINSKVYEIITENGRKVLLGDNHIITTSNGIKLVSNVTTEDSLLFNKNKIMPIYELDKHLQYWQGLLLGLFVMYGEYNISDDNVLGFTLKIPVNVYNNHKVNLKHIKPIQSSLISNNIVQYYNDNSLIEFLQTWTSNNIPCINCIAQSIEFREGLINACINDNLLTSYNQEFLKVFETLLMSLGQNSEKKVLPYTINNIKKYGLYLVNYNWTKIKDIKEVDNRITYTIADTYFTLNNGLII